MSAELGHGAAGRAYLSQAGELHLNGANLYDQAEAPFPQQATFTPAASTSNVCNVTIQLQDGAGNSVAVVTKLDIWLSDAATGIGLTGTTASGGVAAGSSGTILGALTTSKALSAITDAAGKFILAITDTSKTGFYVACTIPGTNKVAVSAALVTGNYG